MGAWQNSLGRWTRWWNIQIQVNPTQVGDHDHHSQVWPDLFPLQVSSNISTGEILDSLFFDSEDMLGVGAGIGITPLDNGVVNVSSSAATEAEEVR